MATIPNYTNGTLISGTSSSDSIRNGGSNVTIDAMSGDDTVYSYGDVMSINGGEGNNFIYLYDNAKNVTILTSDGADTLDSGAKVALIVAGNGNDSVHFYANAENHTIDAGEGNDSIYTGGQTVSVNAGSGDDYIHIYTNATKNTILAGKGNDTIKSYNENGVVYQYLPGDGNDSIWGFKANDTLIIGDDGKGIYSIQTSDDDMIVNIEDDKGRITLSGAATLEDVNIEGIAANVIVNRNSNTTIRGTSDTIKPDAIYNHGHDVTIQALGGNDSIENYGVAPSVTGSSYGSNVSINSGNGDDSVYNNGRYSVIDSGNGNDTIFNSSWGLYSTIKSGEGNDSIHNDASNVTINSGVGNDTVLNHNNSHVSIDVSDGDDSVNNFGSNVTIVSGIGNDTIWNNHDGESILADGGMGKDYIVNFGNNSTLFGGEGDDTINNSKVAYSGKLTFDDVGKNVIIEGGDGNDSIKNSGDNVTINAGAGNDRITIGSEAMNNLILYKPGDGNDTITGFNATSTLKIGDGKDTYSKNVDTVSGNVFVSVGSGVITLSGAASLSTINIEGSLVGGGDTGKFIDNTASNKSVTGTTYDDTINNSGSNVTINALKGNDYISLGSYALNNTFVYTQGDGFDTIRGFKANDTVSIVGSSDYTKDSLDNDLIISLNGGELLLKDTASLTSSVKINGGNEKKNSGVKIENESAEYLLSGTGGRDTLNNYAGGATIKGDAGNDYIYNSTKSDYKINGGYGYVTIDGGAGNDTIFSYDPNVSISSGANADLISLRSSDFSGITINAGTGDDTIYGNSNNYGVLYQYAKNDGNDTIYNFGSNDTLSISGAAYTSDIVNGNVRVSVEGGGFITLVDAANKDIYIYPPENSEGKFITNSNDNTLLIGSKYVDTIKNYGDNVTIGADNGNDIIYNNKGDRTSINSGAGNDSIYGNNDYVTVSAGAGYDTISGNHWRSKLSGDADNDLISITTYWYNTLDGGTGNDTIIAGGSVHSVNGGAGADSISLSGDALTVAGGTGDDTIYGNTATSHLYEYGKGDGNDIIYNYGSNDSITISGSTWSTTASGENVIVKIADSGNVTLMGAKGKPLNIYPSTSSTVESGVTAQDVIKKFMGVLDTTSSAGKSALDEAVSIASGGYFANIGAAIEQMTLDCIAAGNATKFLEDYCGIILNNEDTGAISGYDAGGSNYQKTAKSIVPEEGGLNNFTDNNFTIKGLEVQLSSFDRNINPSGIDYNSLPNDAQKYIWQAFENWWVDGALDLIAESYGDNYGFSDKSSATVKKMYFGFVNDDNNTLATTWHWRVPSVGKATQLAMTVNMKYYDSTTIGDENGKSSVTSALLDRTLAHEMTHAVMASNITHFSNLPQFIKEGMAELTHGIDDERGDVISYLGGNATILNNSLNLTDTGTGTNYAYAGGYMFLRYFAKQAAEHYPTSSNMENLSGSYSVSYNEVGSSAVTIKSKLLTLSKDFAGNALDLNNYSSSVKNIDATALVNGIEITGNTSANSVVSGSGNDTVFSNVGNDTLKGGKGNDVLYGEAGNDKLYGQDGDDTLCGGTGNDTLKGGDGNDVFVHVVDNDFIDDYTAGKDKIKLVEGSIVSSSVSGSNVILDVGMYGLITVKGGKDMKITIVDGDGNETTQKYPVKVPEVKIIDDSATSKITLGSSVITGDASARTKAIRLTGNALNNTILGGSGKDSLYGKEGDDYLAGGAGSDKLSGYTGNDTLWGGTGNDTLTGGDGSDLFIYSAGNDVISDYAKGDKISIGAAISKSSIKGSDATFTIGSNTLKIKDGFGKEIVFIDAEGAERTVIGGAYLANDSSNTKSTLSSWREVGDATARTKAIGLTGNALNNTILGGSGKDSLYGKEGDDYLAGGAGSDKLSGYTGNDTLWGGTGNDTLTGGNGSDLFIYSAGNDVVSDYAKGDKISIGAAISKSSIKGSDATFTIGSNTLTVKNGFGKEIVFIDAEGAERTIIGGAYLANDSSNAKSTLSSWREVGDATARTTAIGLTGNALNNTILGGSGKDSLYGKEGDDYLAGGAGSDKLSGYTGNDTLWGGTGNDTLTGGAGADVFIYNSGEGKDIISDFANDDMLLITGEFSASYNADKNTIAFKVGSTASAITLKNFTATTFNVNGMGYYISGKKLVK